MPTRTGFCLAAAVAIAIIPSTSTAAPSTRDLRAVLGVFNGICSAKWQDKKLLSRVCRGFLPERMLMALQKIETGRTHLDLRAAPTIVPGSGIMNELIFVAFELNSACRGISTDDSDLGDAICSLRDRMFTTLPNHGFCYGKRGQIGADMQWHRCTSRSLR